MNLKDEEKALLSILKSGLWQSPLNMREGFSEWERVVGFARYQSVLGIVAKTILSDWRVMASVPNDLRLKLKSVVVSNVLTSKHVAEVLLTVQNKMSEDNVRTVLLKGYGLAQCYPYPELRQCGDIDLYVSQDQLHQAHAALKKFAGRVDDERYVDCGKHFTAMYDEVEIEIHRHISTHVLRRYKKAFNAFARSGLTENLDSVVMDGRTMHTPEVTFNSYYVFEHLFEHFLTSGVGLRQICDWMLFLHVNKDRIDRDRLGVILKTLDMLSPWQTFGAVLVKYLGMPAEEFPFYDSDQDPDQVLRYILDEGNFGKTSKYYSHPTSSFLTRKLTSLGWHIKRGTKMITLFPKHEIRHFIFIVNIALQYIRTHFMLKFSNGR